jgi:hypothetical protein
MGAKSSCPQDFEQGTNVANKSTSCRMKCPAGFKYMQDRYSLDDMCVLFTDNSQSFKLVNLPLFDLKRPLPDSYLNEKARVIKESERIKSVAPFKDNLDRKTIEYSKIQSEYAGFSAVADAGKKIKTVSDSLKLPRPPVQPNPIHDERTKILNPPSMIVIQVALITILLSLVIFMVVPSAYAMNIVFLTLCVGVSIGFYLSSR